MSSQIDDINIANDASRREIIVAAGAMTLASVTASALISPALGQTSTADNARSIERSNRPLGARIQGVQHFGITVQNMDRAFEFYTEVLGGTEVVRDGNFQGERIHNTLLLNEEIEAKCEKIDPKTIGVPDLRGGAQRLDVRFVQFDNVVLELLQYRDQHQPQGSGDSFARPHEFTSPAYPRSLHICFYIRDDIDFNQFIHDLEAEAARRGMTNVRANRTIAAATEQERQQAPLDTNTFKITQGPSDGWSLIYVKGPEGEQLEFVQVLGHAKQLFGGAFEARRQMLASANR
jgi:catechol 2,3-dioxygenase-like lactoylglutathione lyase family enzyme